MKKAFRIQSLSKIWNAKKSLWWTPKFCKKLQ